MLKNNKINERTVVMLFPENFKHPLEQIIFINNIVGLINTENIKVVILTHSNNIINELNNIILEKGFNYVHVGFYKLNTNNNLEILDKDIDEFGLYNDLMIEANEYLYNRKCKIINKLNQG